MLALLGSIQLPTHLMFKYLETVDKEHSNFTDIFTFTLLHSEQPKLYGVLAVLSAIGLKSMFCFQYKFA